MRHLNLSNHLTPNITVAVIAVAPTGKASFVCSSVQTRVRGQYNGKWSFSLVYMLKPLTTAIRAICGLFLHQWNTEKRKHVTLQKTKNIFNSAPQPLRNQWTLFIWVIYSRPRSTIFPRMVLLLHSLYQTTYNSQFLLSLRRRVKDRGLLPVTRGADAPV